MDTLSYLRETLIDAKNLQVTVMLLMATQAITLVLLIFSRIFSLTPIVKDILYRDYNTYEELIYNLRQIKLFYSKRSYQ